MRKNNIWVTEIYLLGKWQPRKGSISKKTAIAYRNDLLNYDKVWNKKNTRIVEYAPVSEVKP